MDIGGQLYVAGDLVAGLAVPSGDRDDLRRAKRVAVGQRHSVFRTVERDTRVVGHAAVHRDERASAGLDFTDTTRYSVTPARALIARPGSTTIARPREPFRGACPVERIVDDVGELGQVEFGIAC